MILKLCFYLFLIGSTLFVFGNILIIYECEKVKNEVRKKIE